MPIPPSIAALAHRSHELSALLQAWCEVNSGSDNRAGLDRMRALLRDEFARSFPAATIDEPQPPATPLEPNPVRALCVRTRPAAPIRILLSGHFDTVYGTDNPFQRCTWLDEGVLGGPGVADMKGGLVTLLAALVALEDAPEVSGLGWEVLLIPDEETGSVSSEPLIHAAALRNHFGLVFEPARANGAIVKSRMGVGDFIVTSRGRAAHAGAPQEGRNAILALAQYALLLAGIPAELPGVLLNVGEISGGTASNIVAEFAQVIVDVRIARTSDSEPILRRLHGLAAAVSRSSGVEIAVSGAFHRPPKECTPNEEAAFAQWQRAASDLGLDEIAWVHTGGASDGNLLSSYGLPNLDGLGPVGGQLHSDREYCLTKTIAERAQIAALVLHRLASDSTQFAAILSPRSLAKT